MSTRLIDLGQPYFSGMPHFPTHPPFLFGLTKLHGEVVGPDGMSSSADSIAFSGHCGTHIDALGHFSCAGFVYGDVEITNRQSYAGGIETHDAASIAPIYRRGVLLDVAALQQIASLPADFEITEAVLKRACERQGVEVREGDVVLIRTGWGAFFKDAKRYVNNTVMPGMVLSGAEWLSNRKVFAAGSDTLAFERLPSPAMSVHVHLLVKSGIHLIENLALEELASETPAQFTFAASCLKIQGGTGSPVRPFAIIEV